MGNKPSIGMTLEQRFGDLQKEYLAAREEGTLDIWTANDLRRKLAKLSQDLREAIDDKKVKITDHSIEDLLDSIKNLDQTLKLLEAHYQSEQVEIRQRRRLEAIALKERDDLEHAYESMLKDVEKERDRRFNVLHHAEMAVIRCSENQRAELELKVKDAQLSFDEIEKQLAQLKSKEGMEHWIAEHKLLVAKQRQEQERLDEERRRNAPDVPVKILDFGPVKDPLSQLKNALLILLEAGNSAGGFTQPDLDDVAMAQNVSRIAVQISNLLDHSELNQAGHTRRIYDSVDHVVQVAYKAGYNIDDPTVQKALKNLVIAYASAAYDSDSGERDQDAKLLPGLYGNMDTLKKY